MSRGNRGSSRQKVRKSSQSPVPELELSGKTGTFDGNGQFIDQTEDDADEPALVNLRSFQTKLVFVGDKIDHYAQ